jgi:hypothetical protein
MITALLLSEPVVFAQAGPSAKTPDELIERMVGASNKGDADAFLAAMTDRSWTALKEAFAKRALPKESQGARFQERARSTLRKNRAVKPSSPGA